MNFKDAGLRAVRTFFQTLAGALAALPTVEAVADIRTIGEPALVALWIATHAGVIAFLLNSAEDNTKLHLPK